MRWIVDLDAQALHEAVLGGDELQFPALHRRAARELGSHREGTHQ
ncbi:hypothetical protein [Streptomyces sp. NPDC091217]